MQSIPALITRVLILCSVMIMADDNAHGQTGRQSRFVVDEPVFSQRSDRTELVLTTRSGPGKESEYNGVLRLACASGKVLTITATFHRFEGQSFQSNNVLGFGGTLGPNYRAETLATEIRLEPGHNGMDMRLTASTRERRTISVIKRQMLQDIDSDSIPLTLYDASGSRPVYRGLFNITVAGLGFNKPSVRIGVHIDKVIARCLR